MSTSQKITQKITLPQGLTEALRVSMDGLVGFRAEIEKRMAEKDITVTQIVEMMLAGSIALNGSDIHIGARRTTPNCASAWMAFCRM